MSAVTCSAASLAADEPLAGTAPRIDALLLVEVRGAWERDAIDSLPEGAAATVRAWLDATPRSRLLLIRRPDRRAGGLAAFLVTIAASEPTVRRFAVARLEHLRELDLAGGGERIDEPIALVCGHGRRDACCARLGRPLYDALSASLPPESLWLSSHQGGHRFAPNLLWLPGGLAFGRVDVARATLLAEELRAGRLPLEWLRGRVSYSPEAQAAEIAARKRFALGGLADVALVSSADERVRLRTPSGEIEVDVVAEPVVPLPASCGAEPEPGTRLVVSRMQP